MSGINTSGIEINEDGSTTVFESDRDKERKLRRKALENIRLSISDVNYDPAEASRLIAIEISRITEDLSDCAGDGTSSILLKIYEQQLKALRELGKQLTDADLLSKKDILNFDGPKFTFVLGIIIDNFVKSMKEAGVPEDMRTSIMKHFRDNMQMSEAAIRRETARLDSKKS